MEGQNLALRVNTFTGARLILNGQQLTRQKGIFSVRSNIGDTIAMRLKGRFLDPIPNLIVGGETIQIMPPLAWYQYIWMSIPMILLFLGGAIGGLCGGLAAGFSSRIFRSDRSQGMKYALTGLISIGAFVAYFVVVGTILTATRK
jgi:hypothetical protein